MASKSTNAEVLRRVGEVFPLICDCLSLREIRAYVRQKTDWGSTVSDATLKRYCASARKQMKEAARFDRSEEYGAAKRRLERILARAAAKGELRTMLQAQRQLTALLGLEAPQRYEVRGPADLPDEELEAISQKLLGLLDAQAERLKAVPDFGESEWVESNAAANADPALPPHVRRPQ
jgi:hypothetical protein